MLVPLLKFAPVGLASMTTHDVRLGPKSQQRYFAAAVHANAKSALPDALKRRDEFVAIT